MTKFLKNADVTGYISQTSVTSSLLKTDANGKLVAATAGTDYQAPTTALLPAGGTAGQILSKINATDYNTQWIDNFAAQLKHEVKLGATLSKGAAVYVSSANGTNMIVSAASNASEATSSKTLGLLETGGVTNDLVKVITEGLLAGLDTSTATAGDPVWLGVNGALIFGLANKPVAPAHMVFIGIVTRVQSVNGEIFVKVQNGFELDELHNVSISSLANNHTLVWESATSLWKNKTIAAALGYTPADDAAVVKLTGNQTVAGVKTFTSALLANNPSEGATGEGLIAGQSFKIDGTGTGQRSIMYVVSRTLSDTYGSGLIAQYANFDGDKAFGFNLNTAGGFELYVKNTTFNKALAIANTMAATFGSSVTATSFIKSGGTSAQFLKADGSVDSSTYVSSSALSSYLPLTGGTLTGDLTLSGTNPKLYFTDTDNNPDYFISNTDGTFTVYDVTNSVGRFKIYTTGNAEFNNNLTAASFIKSGGTSAQFLKADGSVDSSTYLTTGTASSTYLALSGGTLTGAVTGTRLVLVQNSADIALSIVQTGAGRGLSVLGTSYFSSDISFGSLSNGILKANALGGLVLATAGTDYLVSYTETDTLATVTARGATTATNITLTGGGNTFNGHHYFSAYDANGNHYPHYNPGSNANGSKLNLRMFDDAGNTILFHLNGSSKAIEWNGNTILHAGNYSSYAQPVLYKGVSTSGDFQTFQSATGVRFDQVNATGGLSNPPGGYTYGGVLSLRGLNFGFQLWGSHTGDFYYKTQWSDDNYSGWRQVITSLNIGSQSVSYATSAGVATNLNAADATQIKFNSVTNTDYSTMTFMSRAWSAVQGANGLAYNFTTHTNAGNGGFGALQIYYGESGYVYSPTSFRAPIFYDSNDTSYYGDFAGTSSVWGLAIRGDNGASSTANQIFFWGTGNTTTSAIGFKSNAGSFGNPTGSGDGYNTYFTMDTDGRGWVFRRGTGGTDFSAAYTAGWILNNGIAQFNSSVRAPIFYDSEDTGYYLNPNGYSRLSYGNFSNAPSGRSLSLGTDDNSRVYDDTRHSLVINSPSYPHLYVNATTYNGNTNHGAVISMTGVLSGGGYRRWGMGIANTDPTALSWGCWDNQSNPHYSVGGTLGYVDTGAKMWLNNGGALQVTGSMRAPIFYDSEDTGYYLDPNTTGTSGRFRGEIFLGPNSAGRYTRLGGNGGGTDEATVSASNGNLHIDCKGGYGLYLNYYSTNTIYFGNNGYTITGNGSYYNGRAAVADNANSISSAVGGSYSWTGVQYFVANRNTSSDSPPLQAYSNNGGGAIMSFHRGGYYAVNFGLDSDNVMRIGGWSAGANRWQLDMSGNMSTAGNITAGGAIYSADWLYSYGNAGWYNNTYGQGLRQSKGNVSYGNVITVGENYNGWSGYNTTNTYVTCFMQNSAGTHGFYQEGGGNGWTAFYNFGYQCWGLGNDATDPSYSLHITKYGGSNTGWIIWSDRRIKENIKTIDSALDKVLSLRGVYYNKIDDPNKERQVGYIAQEVLEVVPELVVYSEELDIYNMNYAPMVSMLTEATKEHYAKTLAQQAEIDALKEQVQTLLNHINNGV